MKIQSTKDLKKDEKIHVALFGASGSGKTRLIQTLKGRTLILNADKGLLTLKNATDIDYVNLNSFTDVIEAMKFIQSDDCKYDNIAIDSMSSIAELLSDHLEKKGVKGFEFWKDYGDLLKKIIKTVRDSTKFNSVSIYELVRKESESGLVTNTVGIQGSLASKVSYFYDCFLAARTKNTKDGTIYKLQTKHVDGYECKIRGGENIEAFIEPDLEKLFSLIREI